MQLWGIEAAALLDSMPSGDDLITVVEPLTEEPYLLLGCASGNIQVRAAMQVALLLIHNPSSSKPILSLIYRRDCSMRACDHGSPYLQQMCICCPEEAFLELFQRGQTSAWYEENVMRRMSNDPLLLAGCRSDGILKQLGPGRSGGLHSQPDASHKCDYCSASFSITACKQQIYLLLWLPPVTSAPVMCVLCCSHNG